MKAISGDRQHFAILGHPIQHTLSPAMHNAAFRALGMNAVYEAFDVTPGQVISTLQAMAERGLQGANITVPLKEVAFKGLADLDRSARVMGAVNTVQFLRKGPRGFNTDGIGFLRALDEAFGISPRGLKVFVLGCGGAGRAVAIASAMHGARSIALADIDPRRVRKLAAGIRRASPKTALEKCTGGPAAWIRAAQTADLVIHATPIGMRTGEKSLLTPEAFHKGQAAFDLVYNVPETDFMRSARAGGARAVNGLGMLLHQGAAAFTIWTGKPAPVEVMRKALKEALCAR